MLTMTKQITDCKTLDDGWDITDAYIHLEHRRHPQLDKGDWLVCPKCAEKPRVWQFDNGNYAKCKCFERYENGVSAESICESMTKHNGSMGFYDMDGLRKVWNNHIKQLIEAENGK
jgi:hypothetical protein